MSGIGCPKSLVENLKNGKYEPHISQGAKTKAAIRINLNHQAARMFSLCDEDDNSEYSDRDYVVNNVSACDIKIGSIPVSIISDTELKTVELDLQNICQDIITHFNNRFPDTSLLMTAIQTAYGNPPDTDSDTDTLANSSKANISQIIKNIPGQKRECFEDSKSEIISEHLRFLTFWADYLKKNQNNTSADTSLEEIYRHYFKEVENIHESQIYIHFFEHLMIRTCSEAIAESVGSIMGIAMKRGRNTHPINFEKEIKMRFNLLPLHLLKETFIPELVDEMVDVKKKEYFRKGDSVRSLNRKYKYTTTSSAIGNLRQLKEASCANHLPRDFLL